MAKVTIKKKGATKKKENKPAPRKRIKEKKEYSLPTAKSVPSENMNDYSFLIYGRKKIGKTSLGGRREKTLFFMFEPGAKAQEIYKVPEKGDCFTDWSDVIGYVKQLAKGGHDFETVIFDTGRPAYDLCLKYYCEKNGISHPGEQKDFGASWAGVAQTFKDIHLQIAGAGMGFVVIGHEKWDTFTGADGKKYDRVTMNFPGACNDFYEGVIDVIAHYEYVGGERWLTIRGDETVVAGCRIENHFLTPKGEELWYELQKLDPQKDESKYEEIANALGEEQIYKIPMGNNPHISQKNLIRAFNNLQEKTYKEVEKTARKKSSKKKTVTKKRNIKLKKK